jgi:hypothetical protein
VFRREFDGDPAGEPERYSVYGLWGSGNVVADRDALFGEGEPTAWTMWDGHALLGPGRPTLELEKFPIFMSTLATSEFLARYAGLGDRCEVWTGEEDLGIGCEPACEQLVAQCPDRDLQVCLDECGTFPRALVDCMAGAGSCAWEGVCGTLSPGGSD